jgi:hypothetical protein
VHDEGLCNEVEKTIYFDRSLELSCEASDTIPYDGHVDSTYDVVFRSTNVDDSPSYLNSDAYDELGVLTPKYDEYLVLADFPLDVELMFRELCMRDDEYEIRNLSHELHMELSLAHYSSFYPYMEIRAHEDVSGNYGFMDEILLMVEHEEHSNFHGLGGMDYKHFTIHIVCIVEIMSHLFLGSQLMTQVINVDAPTYCGY